MTNNFEDFDVHYRPFQLALLIDILNNCATQFPGCRLGRSGHGIGNLCIYDRYGSYVGVIDLGDPPELTTWEMG